MSLDKILDLITEIGFIERESVEDSKLAFGKYSYKDYLFDYNKKTFMYWLTISRDIGLGRIGLLRSQDPNIVYNSLSNEFKEELRELNINKILN